MQIPHVCICRTLGALRQVGLKTNHWLCLKKGKEWGMVDDLIEKIVLKQVWWIWRMVIACKKWNEWGYRKWIWYLLLIKNHITYEGLTNNRNGMSWKAK